MALTATAVYVPVGNQALGLAQVALVIGMINLPAVSIWTAIGVQMRRVLDRPQGLRAFNVLMALLLVASFYPTLTMAG